MSSPGGGDLDQVLSNVAISARARAAADERAALRAEDFDELVRLQQRRIYRVIYSLLRDPDAADSLTQDCFLRAWRHRARFRGECRVDTWLVRIAVNLATDHLRNRRRAFWGSLFRRDAVAEQAAAEVEPRDPQPSAERALLAREQAAAAWGAAARLPLQQRTVFLLRFAEEMSIEEIAFATGLEPGTVKSHLHRALVAVREAVALRKQND